MPRTTTVESPGCPSLRALTFDVLGLIKVIEAKGKGRTPATVVERWGEPDSSKGVLASSIIDREFDPLIGVARKNGLVELLSPINGDVKVSVSVSNDNQTGSSAEDDAVTGLHLFGRKQLESSSRLCTFLTCTTKGQASIRSIELPSSQTDANKDYPSTTWKTCGSGNVLCSKVDQSENFALFGGKGVEMNLWDLESITKIWSARSPPKNSLDIFTPTWFTSSTFLNKDDHRKFVAGTNFHQVRLYDTSAQRRPVISVDFRETPIKAVAEDLDSHKIYIGNGSGDLAAIDIRTGKLLGCFLGKCSGSIRSIVRHPEHPVIASCGLDSYLRIWDIESRQLLSAVFLKQHLTSVVFDSYFRNEEVAVSTKDFQPEPQRSEEETVPTKWKKSKVNGEVAVSTKDFRSQPQRSEEETVPTKRKKSKVHGEVAASTKEFRPEPQRSEEETVPTKRKKSKVHGEVAASTKDFRPEPQRSEEETVPTKQKKSKVRGEVAASTKDFRPEPQRSEEETVPAKRKKSKVHGEGKKFKSGKRSKNSEIE